MNGGTAQRVLELDGIRGLAIAAVLALHTAPRAFFWAWSGVDLFFVLSGYLITSILIVNADSPGMLISFYARRALRIWPVYYLALLATVVIFYATTPTVDGRWPALPGGQWLSLLFLQYTDHYFPVPDLDYIWYFGHSWSLAVEEQFYLLWPLLFLIFRPRLGTLCFAVGCALVGAIYARAHGAFFYLLPTRMDGLLFGITTAYLACGPQRYLRTIPPRFFAYSALAGAVVCAPYVIVGYRFQLAPGFSDRAIEVAGASLLFATGIAAALRWRGAQWLAPLRWNPLVALGRISFAVYMYHLPIGYLALLAETHGWITGRENHVLVWVLSIGLGQVSFRLIERHALALKSRFPYRPGKSVVDREPEAPLP